MESISTNLTSPFIFFCIALLIRALFSFLEISVTTLRLFKLKEIAASFTDSSNYSRLFKTLEEQPQRILIMVLIASCLVDVIAASLGTYIMEMFFARYNVSSGIGFSIGIGLTTLSILIFGEIIPKNLARINGEKLFKSTLGLINILYYVLQPAILFITGLTDLISYRIIGKRIFEVNNESIASEKEIQFLINHIKEKGLMEIEKTEMLQNVFELGHTPVKDIMAPMTDVISLNVETSINQALEVFAKHGFTRLPIYEDKTENIIGMIHQKDIFFMLLHKQEKTLKELARPILFIPESIKVNQLLREFRQQHMHIAMIINEYGSVTGLITLEDVLEEIVGEIIDEHEPVTEKIIPLKQGGWLIDASTALENLSKILAIDKFETEDAITLGGFLIEQLNHLPVKGERILYKNFYFQIQKASAKRVLQVLVFKEKHAMPLDPDEDSELDI